MGETTASIVEGIFDVEDSKALSGIWEFPKNRGHRIWTKNTTILHIQGPQNRTPDFEKLAYGIVALAIMKYPKLPKVLNAAGI